MYSPFSHGEYNSLVCIASGVVADKCVNADQAFELGIKVISAMTGQTYPDLRLKRKDRIISISGAKNQITVCRVEVEMNSSFIHEGHV